MDSLEKFTEAMKFTESKKVHVEKAMLSLFVEWKDLDEQSSNQKLLQDCFTEVQSRQDRLNTVQQSVTNSNQVLNEIRESLEKRIEEVETKEKEFRVMYEEKSKELGLKEKTLDFCKRFVDRGMTDFDLREKKLDEQKKLVQGVFEKFSLEKSEFERIKGLIEERLVEVKLKEKSIENREIELDRGLVEFDVRVKNVVEKEKVLELKEKSIENREVELDRGLVDFDVRMKNMAEKEKVLELKEKSIENREIELNGVLVEFDVRMKNVVEKEKVLELKETDFVSIQNLNEKKSKEVESREESLVSKEKKLDIIKKLTQDLCNEYNSQKKKSELEMKVVEEREKELEIKEKYFKEWVETTDLKEKEIDLKTGSSEKRCRELQIREKNLVDKLKEFELKEKQFKEWVKTIDLKEKEVDSGRILNEERCKKLNSMEDNLHELLLEFKLEEQHLKDRVKSFEAKEKEINSIKISCEERCMKSELEKKKEFEMKDMHFKELVKTIDLKEKEIDSMRILNDERCKKLDSMEKNLHDLLLGFKLKEQHFEDRVKSFEAKEKEVDSLRITYEERCREVETEKKKLEDWMKEFEVKKKQFSFVDNSIVKPEPCNDNGSYADIRFSITMDGKNLLLHLINHKRDLDSMTDEVFRALRLSMDPAKLVLDAMQDFYPKKEDKEFEEDVVCKSSILLLEQLRKISPQIQSRLKKTALELAHEWKNKMKSSHDVIVFLQLLASYGLGSAFEPEEFLSLFEVIGQQIQISELCQLLGYTDKISDLIEVMLKKQQHVKAVRYVCAFGLRDKFQPASLLKDLLKNAEEASKALCENRNCPVNKKDEAIDNIVASLKEAVVCIFYFKLESEYPPECIELFIERLVQQKEVEKVGLSASNNDAVKQEDEKNCKSATVVPNPTEGRMTWLNATGPIPDCKNATAIILANMDGKSLQLFLNENAEDHELLGNDILNALKLSKESAKLVLDAIQVFHPLHFEMGDKHYKSPAIMRSCILLLEQLMKQSPEIKPHVKEDAMKLAFDWKEKMRTPLQILGFLNLITTYGLNSSFEVSELERHFESVSYLKHAPQLCRVFLFSDKKPKQTTTLSICHWHQKESCGQKANKNASLIHSANVAKLVLDAMRNCYYSKLNGTKNVKFFVVKSFIILAEKLLKMSPQIQPRVKEEAVKFAVDWKAQLVDNSSRNPVEVSGLFHLLALYNVASSVDSNELLGLLHIIYPRREVPDLVRLLGLAHKIPDFIKSLIQKGDRLQAIRYIYEFQLVMMFPPVPILKDHISSTKVLGEKICGTATSHEPKDKAISKQLAALRGVVKCIKDHHLEVEYPPGNLLARVQQLQEQANENTERSQSQKFRMKRNAAGPNPPGNLLARVQHLQAQTKENTERSQSHKRYRKKRHAAGPAPGPEAQTQWHFRKHPRVEPLVGTSLYVPSPAFHPMINFVDMQKTIMPFVFNPQNALYG